MTKIRFTSIIDGVENTKIYDATIDDKVIDFYTEVENYLVPTTVILLDKPKLILDGYLKYEIIFDLEKETMFEYKVGNLTLDLVVKTKKVNISEGFLLIEYIIKNESKNQENTILINF